MKLTKQEKIYFTEAGYNEEDLPQIGRAVSATTYTLFNSLDDPGEQGKKIPRKRVLEIMDRKKYLSGIGRSAFHHTAMRDTTDGRYVLFECHLWD